MRSSKGGAQIIMPISRRQLLAAIPAGLMAVHAANAAETSMKHVVLLGDSIFDNAAYVAGGPDVVKQLREVLPGGWQATLRAVDGNVIADIPGQLARLPGDASHLVVSVGGNDVLGIARLLDERAGSVAEALARVADAREQFRNSYAAMLDALTAKRLPVAVCTIYDARFPDPQQRRVAKAGLAVFNDCITREVFARELPLLDLRLICNDDGDFANPIEPSVQGGAKIARAISGLLASHDFAEPRSKVWVR
jgi:lysophospholipase L1-like esterase